MVYAGYKDQEKRKEYLRMYNKKWRENNPDILKNQMRRFNHNNRMKVLIHYSSSTFPICGWPNCEITDIDMLCIDHINENGSEHRKALGSGYVIWRKLIKDGFPPGYQVLCFNHNWKKHLEKRRSGGQ